MTVSRLLDGDILVELKMESLLLLFIFHWMSHVSTLFKCNNLNANFVINECMCASLDVETGSKLVI
jgi:hypothetical protein